MDAHAGFVPEKLIGACGLYCASCPANSSGACPGCRFLPTEKHCYCARCAETRGIPYCGQCEAFPCGALLSEKKATALSKEWLEWKLAQKHGTR
ncbi:MAG TPA: DUF3795 domain-containing protein [Eubacteriales bacterium]|nr:DUF3795 domain-containing protein [Eubacteriales bacterium]